MDAIQIEVKSVKLTKSKINQLVYAGLPKTINIEILGWVNLGKLRWVIIKSEDRYYRAEFITELGAEAKGTQMPSKDGGYEFPTLTHVKVRTFNRGVFNYSPDANDSVNLEWYDMLVKYKKLVEEAGQIFY